MSTSQELYDETKNRLDNNIQRLQLLKKEIKDLQDQANQLTQPILEDQGALKALSKLDGIKTAEAVESK